MSVSGLNGLTLPQKTFDEWLMPARLMGDGISHVVWFG